jgi:hypothetical protein
MRTLCLSLLLIHFSAWMPLPVRAVQPAPLGVLVTELDPDSVIVIPVHPDITTTLLFPEAPGVPDGAGFTLDPSRVAGDFRISWQPGDRHLSLVPLQVGRPRNLNVPVAGSIQVFYFECVPKDQALALVSLVPPQPAPILPTSPDLPILRTGTPPPIGYGNATPSRLLGMLTRAKLLHAAPIGPRREALARSLRGVSVAVPLNATQSGPVRIEPVLALRDHTLDLVAFALVLHNTGETPVHIDIRSWAVRAGSLRLPMATGDTPETIGPGESLPAYFVVHGSGDGRPGHLSASNAWEFELEVHNTQPEEDHGDN